MELISILQTHLNFIWGSQIFEGNYDGDTAVNNLFEEGVTATVVQIFPLTWHGGISMRLELLGCKCKYSVLHTGPIGGWRL